MSDLGMLVKGVALNLVRRGLPEYHCMSAKFLNETLDWLAYTKRMVGMDDEVVVLYPSSGAPVFVYTVHDEFDAYLELQRARLWVSCPSFDVLAEYVSDAISNGKKVASVIVADNNADIKEYGQNPPLLVAPHCENPYPLLEKYAGKRYDGKLKIPEINQFKWHVFGNIFARAYDLSLFYDNRRVASISRSHAPKVGDTVRIEGSEFVFGAVRHSCFRRIGYSSAFDPDVRAFAQVFNVDLSFASFNYGEFFQQKSDTSSQ